MIDTLLSFLFPERCAGCDTPGTILCNTCHAGIAASAVFPQGFALYSYSHPLIRKAVWELKYHHKSSLAKALALKGMYPSFPNSTIVLVPIPQHYTKTFSRGFNQSKLLAQWMKKVIPNSTIKTVLKKTRATTPQSHTKNKSQREKNVIDSMIATKQLDPHALYIVIDDVITTGSTIRETARALQAGGAKYVYSLALAHGSVGR